MAKGLIIKSHLTNKESNRIRRIDYHDKKDANYNAKSQALNTAKKGGLKVMDMEKRRKLMGKPSTSEQLRRQA